MAPLKFKKEFTRGFIKNNLSILTDWSKFFLQPMRIKSTKKKFNIKFYIILSVTETLALASLVCLLAFYILRNSIPQKANIYPIIIFLATNAISFFYVKSQARKDSLTGLPNSEMMILFAIKKYILKKLPCYTSIFLNVKNFKYVNRAFGNGPGDLIMKEYAHRIKKFLCKDEYVCHMGGDNFLVLIFKHRVNEFLAYLDNIVIDIEIKDEVTYLPLKSHGGIHALSQEDKIGDVFSKPNIAFGMQKNNKSQDFMWFKQDMAEQLSLEKDITVNLQKAMTDGSLDVYYQPVVDIRTNRIASAEALVRWNKDGKNLLPADFIPILESSGIIGDLDFWVLERVCQNLQQWVKQGNIPVRCSVNFSKLNLHTPNFHTHIIDIINKYDIDKSLIAIELTDSGKEKDAENLKSFISKMSEAHILTVLDDFSICFSNPDLIRQHHLNFIKLNKTFIEEIEANDGHNSNRTLVKNLVNICHDLKFNVICVGVENESQKEILSNMRCNLLQGYLYDGALKKEDFEYRLRNSIYTV